MNYINLTPAQQMRKDESTLALSVLPKMLEFAEIELTANPKAYNFYMHRVEYVQAQIAHHTAVLKRQSKWLCNISF